VTGVPGAIVPLPSVGTAKTALDALQAEIAEPPQWTNRQEYREVFCGDVLLELQDKINDRPWIYRIAEAQWDSTNKRAPALGDGTLVLVTPSLIRQPRDLEPILIPSCCS